MPREFLATTLYSHSDREIVLSGFNAANNSRRQRVLKGLSPEMVLCQRLEAEPALANPTYEPPNRTRIKRALQVVADANQVSQPDSYILWRARAFKKRANKLRSRLAFLPKLSQTNFIEGKRSSPRLIQLLQESRTA